MPDENQGNSVKSVIDATTGLAKAVPIYEDAIQPAAKEIGKSLEVVGKAINVALAPISGLVWGYEKIQEFVQLQVSEKLKDIPTEDIHPPSPHIAGPALEALKYTGHEKSLREMYANLLATAINSKTSSKAHPAFVEVIRQLSPSEAIIINHLFIQHSYPVICEHNFSLSSFHGEMETYADEILGGIESEFAKIIRVPYVKVQQSSVFLDNLTRLKIIELTQDMVQVATAPYENIGDGYSIISDTADFEKRCTHILRFSKFGMQFVDACVKQT